MSLSSVDSGPLHVKHQVDLNIATEANRILYVLNKVINRTKFAGLIKNLIHNEGELLKDIIDDFTLIQVVQTCQRYMISNRLASFNASYSIRTYDDMKTVSRDTIAMSRDETFSSETDDSSRIEETVVKDIVKILYMLEEKPEIQEIVKTLKEVTKESFLVAHVKHIIISRLFK